MIPNILKGVVTWTEIDLDAIAHNVQAVKQWIGPHTEIFASVKANAYGHGLLPVSRTALEAGASYLAVHRIQAAVALREAGIDAPILLMGHTMPTGIDVVLDYNITPAIVDWETAKRLSDHATKTTPVHVKIDTGMSRYGLEPEKAVDLIKFVANLPHLQVEGLFSHFATADSVNLTFANLQYQRFRDVLNEVKAAGYTIPIAHICNSAGVITMPQAHLDAVRPGIIIYGMMPSSEVQAPFPVKRALSLKSTVIHVRTLEAGTSISYGRTYVAEDKIRVALVSLGYGDGYPRLASNRGAVLIHGQHAPIRGRICMDQFVVDISEISGVRIGDEVVAIGEQDGVLITPDDVATWAETINYEITTQLTPQVVRVYRQNGEYIAPDDGLKQWAGYLQAV